MSHRHVREGLANPDSRLLMFSPPVNMSYSFAKKAMDISERQGVLENKARKNEDLPMRLSRLTSLSDPFNDHPVQQFGSNRAFFDSKAGELPGSLVNAKNADIPYIALAFGQIYHSQ